MSSTPFFSAAFSKTYASMPGPGDLDLLSEGNLIWGQMGMQKCMRIRFKDAGNVHVEYGPNQAGNSVKDFFTVVAGEVRDIQARKLLLDTTTVTNFTVEWAVP